MSDQYKTLDDLKKIVDDIEGFIARPTRRLSHPTLYRKRDVEEHTTLIKGVRYKDWLFSEDFKWVLPHDQMGLSFSVTRKHLVGQVKLKDRHNEGAKIHVYWTLNRPDLPKKMKFVEDRKKSRKGHFYLTITEKMPVHELIKKLKIVARQMSIIRDAREKI